MYGALLYLITSASKDFHELILWMEYLLSSATLLPPQVNTFMLTSCNGSKKSLCRLPCRLALCYPLIYTITLILLDWEIDLFSDYSRKSQDPNLSSFQVSCPILSESSCALSAVVLKASWKAGSCNQGFQESARRGSFLPTYGFSASPSWKLATLICTFTFNLLAKGGISSKSPMRKERWWKDKF